MKWGEDGSKARLWSTKLWTRFDLFHCRMTMVCKVLIFTQFSVIFIFLNEKKKSSSFYFCFHLTEFCVDLNFVLVEMLEWKDRREAKLSNNTKGRSFPFSRGTFLLLPHLNIFFMFFCSLMNECFFGRWRWINGFKDTIKVEAFLL